MQAQVSPYRVPNAPGHVYNSNLICDLCDYSLEISHQGPDFDRGVWDLATRLCPNCNQKGIKSFMHRSLK